MTRTSRVELDHVLIAVDALGRAAHEFEAAYGLGSIEGGRHPGWGTANRIVPLGESYLELVAVVDRAEAADSAFGRWVQAIDTRAGYQPFGWAVRAIDLDATAERLGLTVVSGSRITPDGQTLRWRGAANDQPTSDPSLPFFIEWADGSAFPGRALVAHPAGSVRLTSLELSGDPYRLCYWLGTHDLPLAIREGSPAVDQVVLTGDRGAIRIGGHRPRIS
jgi:hypothetical protein